MKPLPVIHKKDPSSALADFDGVELDRDAVSLILADFCKRPTIRELAEENGISSKLFMKAYLSFRQFCINVENLDPMLKVTFSDILTQGNNHCMYL